jgi:hypothetical protein
MTTSTNLLMAILSMDSYCRDYNRQLNVTGTTIGNATLDVTTDINDLPPNAQAVGFYASAYTLSDGTTVISYRGTDDILGGGQGGGNDLLNGWALGAGFSSASQGGLAEQFYMSVIGDSGQSIFSKQAQNQDVILTGHSLGGALAGFVADLTGEPAYVFDNEPFGVAVEAAVIAENELLAREAATSCPASDDVGSSIFVAPGASISHTYTSSEILKYIRDVADPVGGLMIGTGVALGLGKPLSIPDYVRAVTSMGTSFDSSGSWLTLSAWAGLSAYLSPFDSHSMSLLVDLLYAGENDLTQWQAIGSNLFTAGFTDSLGSAIGLVQDTSSDSQNPNPGSTGTGAPSTQMMDAIAYSAASGGSPYGTKAIHSLYADADTLGYLVAKSQLPAIASATSALNDLAEIIVQYAGDVAWTAGQNGGADKSTARMGGVFSLGAGNVLTIDLDPALWTSTAKTGVGVVGAHDFAVDEFQQAANADYSYWPLATNTGYEFLQSLLQPGYCESSISKIASVAASATEIAIAGLPNATIDVRNAAAATRDAGGAIVVAAAGDAIYGSIAGDDLIIGGDLVVLGSGNDVVVAQDANANIKVGTGACAIVGYGDGDTVTFAGDRDQYKVTSDSTWAGMVDIVGPGGGCDRVIDVGNFAFADGCETFGQLLAVDNVGFSAGGAESSGTGGNQPPLPPWVPAGVLYLGSILGEVGNQGDAMSYTLASSDLSSQDFTLTTDGQLYLNPGVQTSESSWASAISTLLADGWNWVSGVVGEMAPVSTAQPAMSTPQQILAGTPYEVTVDVTDTVTGATTEQTLVIPFLGDDALSVTASPTDTATSLSDRTDTSGGVKLADLTLSGDVASDATLSVSNPSVFSIVHGANGPELWLNAGQSMTALAQAGGISASVTATSPYASTTTSFSEPVVNEPALTMALANGKPVFSTSLPGTKIADIAIGGWDAPNATYSVQDLDVADDPNNCDYIVVYGSDGPQLCLAPNFIGFPPSSVDVEVTAVSQDGAYRASATFAEPIQAAAIVAWAGPAIDLWQSSDDSNGIELASISAYDITNGGENVAGMGGAAAQVDNQDFAIKNVDGAYQLWLKPGVDLSSLNGLTTNVAVSDENGVGGFNFAIAVRLTPTLAASITQTTSPIYHDTPDADGIKLATLSLTGNDTAGVTWDTSDDSLFDVETIDGAATLFLKPGVDLTSRTSLYGEVTATAADGVASSVSFDQIVADESPTVALGQSTAVVPMNSETAPILLTTVAVSGANVTPWLEYNVDGVMAPQISGRFSLSQIGTGLWGVYLNAGDNGYDYGYGGANVSDDVVVGFGNSGGSASCNLEVDFQQPLSGVSFNNATLSVYSGENADASVLLGTVTLDGGDAATSLSVAGYSSDEFSFQPTGISGQYKLYWNEGAPALGNIGDTFSPIVTATDDGVSETSNGTQAPIEVAGQPTGLAVWIQNPLTPNTDDANGYDLGQVYAVTAQGWSPIQGPAAIVAGQGDSDFEVKTGYDGGEHLWLKPGVSLPPGLALQGTVQAAGFTLSFSAPIFDNSPGSGVNIGVGDLATQVSAGADALGPVILGYISAFNGWFTGLTDNVNFSMDSTPSGEEIILNQGADLSGSDISVGVEAEGSDGSTVTRTLDFSIIPGPVAAVSLSPNQGGSLSSSLGSATKVADIAIVGGDPAVLAVVPVAAGAVDDSSDFQVVLNGDGSYELDVVDIPAGAATLTAAVQASDAASTSTSAPMTFDVAPLSIAVTPIRSSIADNIQDGVPVATVTVAGGDPATTTLSLVGLDTEDFALTPNGANSWTLMVLPNADLTEGALAAVAFMAADGSANGGSPIGFYDALVSPPPITSVTVAMTPGAMVPSVSTDATPVAEVSVTGGDPTKLQFSTTGSDAADFYVQQDPQTGDYWLMAKSGSVSPSEGLSVGVSVTDGYSSDSSAAPLEVPVAPPPITSVEVAVTPGAMIPSMSSADTPVAQVSVTGGDPANLRFSTNGADAADFYVQQNPQTGCYWLMAKAGSVSPSEDLSVGVSVTDGYSSCDSGVALEIAVAPPPITAVNVAVISGVTIPSESSTATPVAQIFVTGGDTANLQFSTTGDWPGWFYVQQDPQTGDYWLMAIAGSADPNEDISTGVSVTDGYSSCDSGAPIDFPVAYPAITYVSLYSAPYMTASSNITSPKTVAVIGVTGGDPNFVSVTVAGVNAADFEIVPDGMIFGAWDLKVLPGADLLFNASLSVVVTATDGKTSLNSEVDVIPIGLPSDTIRATSVYLAGLSTTQIAALASSQGVKTVAITDGGVAMTAAQALAVETAGLAIVCRSGAAVSLSDTAANLQSLTTAQISALPTAGFSTLLANNGAVAFSVAQVAAIEAAGISVSASTGVVTLSDRAANLATLSAAQVAALPAAGVDAVSTSDIYVVLTAVQAVAFDTAGLSISKPITGGDNVTDTAANIAQITAAQIAGLKAVGVTGFVITGALSLSVAQIVAIEAAGFVMQPQSGATITVSDTPAAIAALTTAQIAGLPTAHVSQIVASGQAVLTVAQALALQSARVTVAGPGNVIAATPADFVGLTANQIAAFASSEGVSTISISGGVSTLTVIQEAAFYNAHIAIVPAQGGSLLVADAWSSLKTMGAAQLATLPGGGATTLQSTSGSAPWTVVQALAIESVGAKVSAIGGTVTVTDSGVAIGAMTPAQIAGLVGEGFSALVAGTGAVTVNVAQALALLGAGLQLHCPSTHLVTVSDTAATLATLTSTQIAALAADGVQAFAFTGSGANLTMSFAQTQALLAAGIVMQPPSGGSVTVADGAATLDALTPTQIASLATLHVGRLQSTDGPMTLNLAQVFELKGVGMTIGAPPVGGVTLADIAGNLDNFAYISYLPSLSVTKMMATDGGLSLTAGEVGAYEAAGVTLAAPAGTQVTLMDNASVINAFTPAQIAAAAAYGVTQLHGRFGNINLSVADTAAVLAAGLSVVEDGAGTVTENFADGGYKVYSQGALIAQKSLNADGSYDVANYAVTGQSYTSVEDVFTAGSAQVAEAQDYNAGSGNLVLDAGSLTILEGPGQASVTNGADSFAIAAHATETIQASGLAGETFAFDGGFGNDILTGLLGTGSAGDVIQLRTADFSYLTPGMSQAQDLAALISNAAESGGNLMVGDLFGDMLTINSVTKAMLTANPSAVRFV